MDISLNNWQYLTSFLPNNWQDLAKSTGAMPRKMYCFDSPAAMLQVLLLHIGKGYSLRETSARSKSANIANISDVGILDSLRRSEIWLQTLCKALYFEQEAVSIPKEDLGNRKIRLIDGSIVKEPGKTGSQWRINYSVMMPDFTAGYFDLVSVKGKGNGESIRRYDIKRNECIIADRGYSRISDIFYVKENNSDIIVRVNPQILPLYYDNIDNNQAKFDLVDNLSNLTKAGDIGEYNIHIQNDHGQRIDGKICAIRKNREAVRSTITKIKKKASKTCRQVSDKVIELAKYTIIFTTILDKAAKTILDWYRVRWQIELAFKRLKSIAGLGHLPKYSDASSRAWLYGKLLLSLLTEKIIRLSKNFSPWGFPII